MEQFKVLTSNKLKMLAMVVMLLDHFAVVFLPNESALYMTFKLLGRFAAPIFCYFIAEGYHYTRDRRKYLIRLLLLALISHIPYNLAFGFTLSPLQATSVVWSLALGLIALMVLKEYKFNIYLRLGVFLLCCILSYTANWNFVAVMWIVCFGLFHGEFKKQMISFSIIAFVFFILPLFARYFLGRMSYLQWYQLGLFLNIPLFMMYNGKLGMKSKVMSWSFYFVYPGHLLILFLLRHFTTLFEWINP